MPILFTVHRAPREGANNAWNYIDRRIGLGTLWSIAEVVSQPKLGLWPDRRRWSRSRHCSRSVAPRAHLDFVPPDLRTAKCT